MIDEKPTVYYSLAQRCNDLLDEVQKEFSRTDRPLTIKEKHKIRERMRFMADETLL